ncbi:UbiX family flavin prenyltransferase [Brenneria izadpanahii]|uniref:Flavin prenyltransferase UbiX n=1 Tax=Brenneria izadpanahii TaxID=2722756 RepID=A0ABX7UVL0_9GAMM|nr:UbiX family flavin prenyltransferase [Brenneria izadpanahii]QTF08592.1 UbiX family flavin prenyltransferase [Brenneria izadpanahii]
MRIVVGITGASGAIYAYTLISALYQQSIEIEIVASKMGWQVLEFECGISRDDIAQFGTTHDNDNLFSPIASGSYRCDGMAIVPCSMNTLGAMANGMGDTLLLRAASVTLKERRPLLVVPRETPLNIIQIDNMATLARAGGIIMPAAPGFYSRPTEISQLVGGMVGRMLDNLGINNDVASRWNGGQ